MNITTSAREKLTAFMADYPESMIRISQVTTGGGCGGKISLGLLPDKNREDDDAIFESDGLTFVIDQVLKENLGTVKVDYDPEKGITVCACGT